MRVGLTAAGAGAARQSSQAARMRKRYREKNFGLSLGALFCIMDIFYPKYLALGKCIRLISR
jgi:hypothetical protein